MMKRWILVVCWLAACRTEAPVEPSDDPVAARVNGRAITEAEVAFAQRRGGPGGETLDRTQALEGLVELELEAQAAEAEGLHEAATFKRVAQQIRTEASTAYRENLAKHFRMSQLEALPDISEATARAWFDANQDRIRAEFVVRQVLTRSRPLAEQAAAVLASGTPWADVKAQFSGEASEPPPIGFDRLAPGWWEALSALSPGESSDPVNLIGDRYVVFQLIERREVASRTFEDVKRKIMAVLEAEALREQRANGRTERRRAATIELAPAK